MKRVLIIAISFALGFLTHAIFFPNLLLTNEPKSKKVSSEDNQAGIKNDDSLITKVFYDGERFSKKKVEIEYGRYIQIINMNDKKPMRLVSSDISLSTPRNYGYTEALQKQFYERGEFVVYDIGSPDAQLVITVK